jgi:cytochrome P450
VGRSGYSDCDDCDGPELTLFRGRVANAFKGMRTQKFLRELRDALDAMPVRELVDSEDGEIVNAEGQCCTLGAIALARGWADAQLIDSTDHEYLASRLGVAPIVVKEIEWENDEWRSRDAAGRWTYMRRWVEANIREVKS